jgi:phosphate:Na+ symporter
MLWYSPSFKEIGSGVAILLFGMISLEHGFKTFAEGPLRRMLYKVTDKFYKSLTLGALSTAILQSSSLISVIAISFISAGLFDLVAGIGIIFGANIGTTATSWLVAVFGLKLKISALAMPMLVFGIILTFQRNPSAKGIGSILAGMGFLFLGIHYMKEGFEAFKGTLNLSDYAIEGIGGLITFTGLGILATVILQSSSATMAIILTALMTSQITYFNALALAIGANIGTTITAILGASASNVSGKRLAIAHLLFNMVTGLIALVFINQLSWLVDVTSGWIGIGPKDYTLKLATFHTIFNLVGIIVMYPIVRPLARWLNTRIKDIDVMDVDRPLYLNESSLAYPQSAIGALFKETMHLFGNTYELILNSLSLQRSDVLSKTQLRKVIKRSNKIININIDEVYYHKIKTIYSKIIEFATLTQQLDLTAKDINSIHHVKDANQYFVEIVKDLKDLQPNMTKYIKSDNELMKKEYNNFRKRLSRMVRTMLNIQDSLQDKEIDLQKERSSIRQEQQLLLNKSESKLISEENKFNLTLETLLREKSIDGDMASSLMNDNAVIRRISRNLLKATNLLYIKSDFLAVHKKDESESISVNDN